MNISDETLMAFADGELDAAERAAVEKAIQDNPDIERRIARHRALRERVRLAYSADLHQPVPERLLAAARRPAGKVVDLSEARAALARNTETLRPAPAEPATQRQRLWWRPVGSIAAGVLLGLALGYGVWQQHNGLLARDAAGAWVASGELRDALSLQLAADQDSAAKIKLGVSYLSKSGEYCRAFELSGADSPAGIACRRGKEWQIRALTQGEAASGEYRTAGSGLPPLLLQSIETQINGEPLDRTGEANARARGWQAAAH